MLNVLFALIFLILVHAPLAVSGNPGARPDVPLTPPSPSRGEGIVSELPPEPCRECGGLRYYPPSDVPAASDAIVQPALTPAPLPGGEGGIAPSKGTSGVPARLDREAASGRVHLSSDPRVTAARALIHRNRFAEALEILKPLTLQDRPDLTDVRFLLGLAASRGSQAAGVVDEERLALLNLAIAAFRSILIKQPELVRVRLELALAFYLKEDDALAQNHFERALVGRPPAALVANINRFLNIMRARRRWRGYFGFSLAPDTNINAASNAATIYIDGLPPLTRTSGLVSSGIGIVGWGGAEYQYPLADRWRLRSGFDLNHREYNGNQFDQTFLASYAGPRWLFSRNTEMSLLATANQRWWGNSPFNYDFGARLEVEHRVYAGFRLSGRAAWQDRKNQQQKGLQGQIMVFSLGANYALFSTVQINGMLGFQQQNALADWWDSQGYWGRVGTDMALPWGFTVGVSAEFRWTDFEAGWPLPFRPDGSARRDQTRILQATLLNRAITVFGFSPQVAFSNQVRESNAQLLDFKRNLVELRWVRQF